VEKFLCQEKPCFFVESYKQFKLVNRPYWKTREIGATKIKNK